MLGVQVGRRNVLRWSGIALLGAPLAALPACSGGYDDSPDPLSAMATAARSDGAAARAIGGKVARQIAELRTAQARALQQEVDRANRPAAPAAKPSPAKNMRALGKRLTSAAESAVELIPQASRARAGLLASVAAGCNAGLAPAQAAALQQEVDRANRPPAPAAKPSPAKNMRALGKRLTSAAESAVELIPQASRARAGLLASVAAGCNAGLALDGKLGSPRTQRFPAPEVEELDEETVDALQQALAAEH